MSAAEKLRALARNEDDVLWSADTEALWSALPQIVAVVEAAELHVMPDVWIKGEPLHGPSIYAELNSGTTASEALRDALGALDEALT